MPTVSGIYEFVRIDIGDPNSQVLTDSLASKYLNKAVMRLNNRLALSKTSRPRGVGGQFGGTRLSVSPITADTTNLNSYPAPNNDEIHDLITLQMEEMVLHAEMRALARLNPSLGGSIGASTSTAVNDDVTVVNPDGARISIGGSKYANRVRLLTTLLTQVQEDLREAIKNFKARMSGSYSKYLY